MRNLDKKSAMNNLLITIAISILVSCQHNSTQETFSPLENGHAPQTLEELWNLFDPQKEPLDVDIIKSGKKMVLSCKCFVIVLEYLRGRKP